VDWMSSVGVSGIKAVVWTTNGMIHGPDYHDTLFARSR